MPPHVHHFPGVQILLPGLSPFTDAATYPNSGVQDRITISVVFDLIMTWRYVPDGLATGAAIGKSAESSGDALGGLRWPGMRLRDESQEKKRSSL